MKVAAILFTTKENKLTFHQILKPFTEVIISGNILETNFDTKKQSMENENLMKACQMVRLNISISIFLPKHLSLKS